MAILEDDSDFGTFRIQTILHLLLKDLVLVQPCLEDTRLPTRVPETEHLEDLAKILEFQNSTALNLLSSI